MVTLKKKLSDDVRFPIYKKALDLIQTAKLDEKYYALPGDNLELCLLLPCILWDLKDLFERPSGYNWYFRETKIAFPEIGPYIEELNSMSHVEYKNKRRGEILQEILKNQ